MGKHSHVKSLSPDQINKYAGPEGAKPNEETKKNKQEEHENVDEQMLEAESNPSDERPLTPEEEKIQNEVIGFVKFLAKAELKTKEAACHDKRITYMRGISRISTP